MKKVSLLLFAWSIALVSCQVYAQSAPAKSQGKLVDNVNILMGTASEFSFSNGNTYPAIATPWGMNFWTPQTAKNGDGWTYNYNAGKIRGIKQTHQPSPWINDYGAFSLMPVTGKRVVEDEKRASWFSHKAEDATPYYYSVYLADYDVTAEVTPSDRAAQFRFTFPKTDSAYIVIDAFDMGSSVKVVGKRKIIGYSKNNHGGVPENFRNYFVMEFDHDFTSAATWDGKGVYNGKDELTGDRVGAVIGFSTKKGERVHVRVASSFISPEQAQINLDRELARDDFETTKQKAADRWEKELNRIQVEGGSLDDRRTFYSCLYRILLFPRSFYEFDASGKVVHYSPYNGKVLPGYMFTDNGFWDTFRAVFPFFTVMYRDMDARIMEGLANAYKESGWLPEWASPGHRDCMIGSNSASLIADAYTKGIRGYDAETLYQAVLKNADNAGPLSSVGRRGAEYYNKLGYVPYDVGINENAARTLEYAYADYAVMQFAKALGKPKADVERFRKQAYNYKNLFDPTTKLMRGKNKDGKFQAPFNPNKWGDAFTEGNSWHYSWSVFQDIKGLKQLMGGDETFVGMLDSVFNMAPVFDASYYGIVIHEIREMQVMGMGQYAHGNQPIQHMVYLYNYAGQPWKTQSHVREIMDKLYHSGPDGYCGDEDNGQTSAWYVFSAMGFYPVCPGSNQYVIGSPLFDKITLTLENGNKFVIEARNNAKDHVYIQKATLNGSTYDLNWLKHDDIMNGGTLVLEMGAEPARKRGVSEEARPFSMSAEAGGK